MLSVGGGKVAASYCEAGGFMHVGVKDAVGVSLLPILQQCVDFITARLREGKGPLLVHCRGGLHRSPAVVAAYLIAQTGITAPQAMQAVCAARPAVSFLSHHARQLHAYANELQRPVHVPASAAARGHASGTTATGWAEFFRMEILLMYGKSGDLQIEVQYVFV